MWIDWSNPPKSIDHFASGKYHREWRPLRVESSARFTRPGWHYYKHSSDDGHYYGYRQIADVTLDTGSNINTRQLRLRDRHLLIRLIKVYPDHRRNGVMTEILEELIDQFPSIDLVACIAPQEGDRQHRDMMVGTLKSTYERLGFMEIDWREWLPWDEFLAFEQRCQGYLVRPVLMALPAADADEKILEIYQEMAV